MDTNSHIIIGHRGAAGLAPENTLAAIRIAIANGISYVEVDVQRTRDGALVLMHDHNVDRTTNGRGKLAELDWPELQKLDAGIKFSKVYLGEGVPRLDHVLELAKEAGIIIVIEAKNPNLFPGLAAQLNKLIESHGAEQHVILMSFDLIFMHQLASLKPNYPLGCIYYLPPTLESSELSFSKFISVHWLSAYLFPQRLKGLQVRGLSTWAWTINRKNWFVQRIVQKFNGIISDFP